MATRLHRLGNIYARIDGLIRKNIIRENNKPLWFDVYKRFPPKYDPSYNRLEPDTTVNEIFYKEDVLRARIHKEFHDELRAFDLNNNGVSVSRKLLNTCQQYISEGMTEDEAIQKLSSTENIQVPLKTDAEVNFNKTVPTVDV